MSRPPFPQTVTGSIVVGVVITVVGGLALKGLVERPASQFGTRSDLPAAGQGATEAPVNDRAQQAVSPSEVGSEPRVPAPAPSADRTTARREQSHQSSDAPPSNSSPSSASLPETSSEVGGLGTVGSAPGRDATEKTVERSHVKESPERELPIDVASGYLSPGLAARVSFDYSNNDGQFTIGQGEMTFVTSWSKASNTSIYAHRGTPGIRSVALAVGVKEIGLIAAAEKFDSSSRVRTAELGEVVIWQNTQGYYAATKVEKIKDRSRGDDRDELVFSYQIAAKGGGSFEAVSERGQQRAQVSVGSNPRDGDVANSEVAIGPERRIDMRSGFSSSAPAARVSFDYSNNDGRFTIGQGDTTFVTSWSKGSDVSIHAYRDGPGMQSVALAIGVNEIEAIQDAGKFDSSSRVRTAQLGEIVIWRNSHGCYAATKVEAIKDRTRGGDRDELVISYQIAQACSASFQRR